MKTNEETREDFMENMADKWRDKYFKLKKQHEAEIKQIFEEFKQELHKGVIQGSAYMEIKKEHLRGSE